MITASHCLIFIGAHPITAPPNCAIIAVNAKMIAAISINSLFLLIPANRFIPSVRILNPLNVAAKIRSTNLAVAYVSFVLKIFCIGGSIVIPNSAINETTETAICESVSFDNSFDPFGIGFSFMYSGSPPNDKLFRESITMLIIRI